jgi:ATP-binding cassette subfamily B (MDR/TAP) protein 1
MQIGFPDIGKAKDAVQSVFPIIDRKSLIDSSGEEGRKVGADGSDTLQGAIALSNVTFAYPARPSVVVFK